MEEQSSKQDDEEVIDPRTSSRAQGKLHERVGWGISIVANLGIFACFQGRHAPTTSI